MKKFLIPIFLIAIASATHGQEPTPSTLKMTLPDGKPLQVEVADTPMEQTRGLMFRTDLPEDHGMLFIFERPGKNQFWMKNTLIPLDILWMDDQKRIIHIEYQVPPCKLDPCPVYGPSAESHYVLEVKAGVVHKRGLRVGMPLQF
ncbi:MAG: DUF192 domain-containing protein [Nitrospirae bacterium]|nr:DUF192 domain-containing protein [Nitrospirota bacterium]